MRRTNQLLLSLQVNRVVRWPARDTNFWVAETRALFVVPLVTMVVCQICKAVKRTEKELHIHFAKSHPTMTGYSLCHLCDDAVKTDTLQNHYDKKHPDEHEEQPAIMEINATSTTVISGTADPIHSPRLFDKVKSRRASNCVKKVTEKKQSWNESLKKAKNKPVAEPLSTVELIPVNGTSEVAEMWSKLVVDNVVNDDVSNDVFKHVELNIDSDENGIIFNDKKSLGNNTKTTDTNNTVESRKEAIENDNLEKVAKDIVDVALVKVVKDITIGNENMEESMKSNTLIGENENVETRFVIKSLCDSKNLLSLTSMERTASSENKDEIVDREPISKSLANFPEERVNYRTNMEEINSSINNILLGVPMFLLSAVSQQTLMGAAKSVFNVCLTMMKEKDWIENHYQHNPPKLLTSER